MGWDGTERRTLHRKAHRSLTCIDRSLRTEPIPPRAVLEALKEYLLEQWMPHLEWMEDRAAQEDERAKQSDEDHAILQRAAIWMNGACYVLRVILPSLIVLCGAIGATIIWIRSF